MRPRKRCMTVQRTIAIRARMLRPMPIRDDEVGGYLVPGMQQQRNEQRNDGIDSQRRRQAATQEIDHRIVGAVKRREALGSRM